MPIEFDQKDRVQQATDIVQLIGETVSLRPRGREFIGLCPFHDDKNPSMYVSPVKQIYKCFSCGAGGDVFSFCMNYHKLTFPESLKHLAERAGIELKERGSGSEDHGRSKSERQHMAEANEKAMKFFRSLLHHNEHGRIAREYLATRGINEAMIEAFQIGYAADKWDGLALTITSKAWPVRDFELAGLVNRRANGDGHVDRMRHRLIFPILDPLNRPIAFGGRILPGGSLDDKVEAKYLNSPETTLFNKSKTLYGIHLAKKPIIDSRTAVIVEGYTDVIAAHQAGAANVVATLGTALTAEHVQVLRRFAEKVVLVFDGDEAGRKAADRAVELFLTGEVDVAIAILPGGQDPADVLSAENGLEVWNGIVAAATDALDYLLKRVRGDMDDATSLSGRQRVAEDFLRKLAQLGMAATARQARVGMVRHSMLVQRLAEMLHMNEAQISELLRQFAPRRDLQQRAVASHQAAESAESPQFDSDVDYTADCAASDVSAPRMKALTLAARHLLGALLRKPAMLHELSIDGRELDEAVTPTDMPGAAYAELLERIHDRAEEIETTTLASLLGDFAMEGRHDLAELATLAEAEVEQLEGDKPEKVMDIATAAAETLVRHAQSKEYENEKAAVLERAEPDDQDARMKVLQRAKEHGRANPSSLRIARVAGGA